MVKSITATQEIKQKVINKYQNHKITPPQYASHAFKKGKLRIVIYNSLKIVFSGEFDIAEIQEFIDDTNYYTANIIGSDEVGTGDFFGPIIVVSAYISEKDISRLENLGIADSKRLNDDKILEIAKQLMQFIKHSVVKCDNKQYNNFYEKGYHIKKILAMMHFKAVNNLNEDCQVVIDQFVEKHVFESYINNQVDYIFKTKAESSDVCVAVASIIARAHFINEMNNIAKLLDVNKVIYGAGVDCDKFANDIYKKIGKQQFENYIKKNFKNYKRIK